VNKEKKAPGLDNTHFLGRTKSGCQHPLGSVGVVVVVAGVASWWMGPWWELELPQMRGGTSLVTKSFSLARSLRLTKMKTRQKTGQDVMGADKLESVNVRKQKSNVKRGNSPDAGVPVEGVAGVAFGGVEVNPVEGCWSS